MRIHITEQNYDMWSSGVFFIGTLFLDIKLLTYFLLHKNKERNVHTGTQIVFLTYTINNQVRTRIFRGGGVNLKNDKTLALRSLYSSQFNIGNVLYSSFLLYIVISAEQSNNISFIQPLSCDLAHLLALRRAYTQHKPPCLHQLSI